MLLLEDDVRLAADWRHWMALCQESGRPVVGYASYPKLYPRWFRTAKDAAAPVTPGVYGMECAPGFWGSQCVYLPKFFLEEIWEDARLHSLEEDGQPFDTFLARHWIQAPLRSQPLLAIPNFCEHLAPGSVLRPRQPNYSYSYGHPVTQPIEEVLHGRDGRH